MKKGLEIPDVRTMLVFATKTTTEVTDLSFCTTAPSGLKQVINITKNQ